LGKKFKRTTKTDKLRKEDNYVNDSIAIDKIGVNMEADFNDKSNYIEDSNI
jgi:hypothetical protein